MMLMNSFDKINKNIYRAFKRQIAQGMKDFE